ncbi:uncharacterized protein V1516DRAFT_687415 [Lipomyces oligophaga]|uniref:uncharacterized protein n=1 Tax=Lipomyces oligophaga TaxID=45792 RepID=UPI0034CED7E8
MSAVRSQSSAAPSGPAPLTLWQRVSSLFSVPSNLSASSTPKFGVFSIVSPLSTGHLFYSLLSSPKSLFSSFAGLFRSAPALKSITAAAPSDSSNAESASSPASPNPVQQGASIFPQIILDVRFTTTTATASRAGNAVSSTTSKDSAHSVATPCATPCATDASSTLFQVHNAGGELIGFDFSDPALMAQNSTSSYMLQVQPQVQFAPSFQQQQQPAQYGASFPPQAFEQQFSAASLPQLPSSDADQGEFLNRLDELELYIAQMRKIATSANTSGPSPVGYAVSPSLSEEVAGPRVVRRRTERQTNAAPYVRPSASPSVHRHTSADELAADASAALLPTSSSSVPVSSFSPTSYSETTDDGSSPSSSLATDEATPYGVCGFPDVSDQLILHADVLDSSESFHAPMVKDELDPLSQPDMLNLLSSADPSITQIFTMPNGTSFGMPSGYPMFEDSSRSFAMVPAASSVAIPDNVSVLSSPRSLNSPPTSVGDSPASSNTSPSSSPPKAHSSMVMASPPQMGIQTEISSMHGSLNSSSSQPNFQCPHCPSKFRIKGYLTRHLKKHAMTKAYSCPFYDPNNSTPCHTTGGFSRRDTYKTHLKSRHFVYPAGTRSDQRSGMRGWCAACGMPFSCNENWVENHVEAGECRALHDMPVYA